MSTDEKNSGGKKPLILVSRNDSREIPWTFPKIGSNIILSRSLTRAGDYDIPTAEEMFASIGRAQLLANFPHFQIKDRAIDVSGMRIFDMGPLPQTNKPSSSVHLDWQAASDMGRTKISRAIAALFRPIKS